MASAPINSEHSPRPRRRTARSRRRSPPLPSRLPHGSSSALGGLEAQSLVLAKSRRTATSAGQVERGRGGRVVLSRAMKEFPSNGAKLQDYEAFIAIVDSGNLTRAAARLRRSLQSVSRSLAALEAQVGVVLIRRTTRTAQPTEAGLAFHRRLSDAFREIALAETELNDTSETLSGTLRIGGSAFFVGHHIVPAIRDFSLQ